MNMKEIREKVRDEVSRIDFSEIAKDNKSEKEVTSDLDLWDGRNTCIGYADVEWRSSMAHVVSPSGYVERQEQDETVSIRARFTFQDYPVIAVDKVFRLTVLKGEGGAGSAKIPDDKIRIFLAGDSTCSNYPHTGTANRYPQTGWGQVFGRFFDDLYVINCARSGRSSKSFLLEENYRRICDNIKEGDYLFIQFAHNDSKKEDPSRYTSSTDGTYQNTLMTYIKLARDNGANPVLCTPISRCSQDDTSLEPYVDAVKALAADEKIPVIDLYKRTREYISQEGADKARRLYKNIKARDKRFLENPEFIRSQYFDVESRDNTHLNIYGALVVAQWATAEIIQVGIPVSRYLNSYQIPIPPDFEE